MLIRIYFDPYHLATHPFWIRGRLMSPDIDEQANPATRRVGKLRCVAAGIVTLITHHYKGVFKAPTILSISLGSPLGCSTTMSIAQSPKGALEMDVL